MVQFGVLHTDSGVVPLPVQCYRHTPLSGMLHLLDDPELVLATPCTTLASSGMRTREMGPQTAWHPDEKEFCVFYSSQQFSLKDRLAVVPERALCVQIVVLAPVRKDQPYCSCIAGRPKSADGTTLKHIFCVCVSVCVGSTYRSCEVLSVLYLIAPIGIHRAPIRRSLELSNCVIDR